MKVALLSYTNLTSGVGVIAHGLFRWLPCDSIYSVASIKGTSRWSSHQVNAKWPRSPFFPLFLRRFKPDVLISVETMWDDGHYVFDACAERGIRTATVIMHESYNPRRTKLGLYICPTRICYNRVQEPHKIYFKLPIEIERFRFTPRTQARRFLHVMGYGAAYNRRQTREVVAGFLEADLPGATLTVHCLQDWRAEYGRREDPTVTYRRQLFAHQRDIYDGFDVLIQPCSYAGFGLLLLEAQACGLPVITTDAAPMNEQVTDTTALVPGAKVQRLDTKGNSPTCVNMNQQLVTSEGVAETIRRVAAGNIRAMSARARIYAVSRAWTEAKAEALGTLLRNIPT